MEINALNIYLFGVLYEARSYIDGCIGGTIFVLAILSFSTFVGLINNLTEFKQYTIRWFKRLVVVLICLVLLRGVAPSKEIVAAMLIVPPVVNNEKIQELPENVLDFVNSWLKENTAKKRNENAF